jgi:hypothetical protein
MNPTEYDEFALLWAQEPPVEEVRLVERLARRASWQGLLLQHVDKGVAIAVAGGIAVMVLRDGSGAAALSGALLVLGLAWTTWKRHMLWKVESDIGAADRELMLADAARRTELRLKRTTASLLLILPLFLLAALFVYRLEGSQEIALVEGFLAAPLWYLGWSGFVAALIVYLFLERRRLRLELDNIHQIGREYGEEARLDGLV